MTCSKGATAKHFSDFACNIRDLGSDVGLHVAIEFGRVLRNQVRRNILHFAPTTVA